MKTYLPFNPLWLFFLVLVTAGGVNAQDIHFSQWINSPLNLNPALAGVFGGDVRFVGNFRSQYQSVPVPYQTFSGSAEGKLYLHKGQYDKYLTGSLLVNSDKQGSLQLQTIVIGLPVSLTLPVGKRDFLTLGVTPAFGQRHFNTNNISFDAQWTGFSYDPSASFREPGLLENTDLKYFDLAAGANFRLQAPLLRNRLDLGISFNHINRPHMDFWSKTLVNPGNVRLYTKTAFYGNTLIQLRPNMDILLNAIYERQGGYRELVYGIGARLHLNHRFYNELALQVGVDRRHYYNDAIIPHVEVLYGPWTVGFTYDLNRWFTDPEVALVTNGRAGPEVSVIYRFFKLKPLPGFKSCPMI